MAIFGLHTSGSHSSFISEKTRRRVLYQYPQGPAPLTYLLSLLPDEETDKTEFGWWEERDQVIKTTTAQAASAGPFKDTSGTDLTAAGWNAAVGTQFRIYLTNASLFQVQDMVWVRNVPNGAGTASLQLRAVVTGLTISNSTTGAGYITVNPIEAVSSISNDTDANGIEVFFVSSVAAEGSKSKTGNYTTPIEVSNYTQIFKHGIHVTRSALKQGLRYDSSGVMADKMKKTGLRHMKSMEQQILRGIRATRNVTNEDGDTVPERISGGLEWFLAQWELRNTGNGGAFDYTTGSSVAASAWRTTEDKRIIDVSGNLTVDELEMLLERMFRYTNETSFEKLCVAGSGFLSVLQKYCELKSLRMTELNPKTDTFGLTQCTRFETLFGTLVCKSHPLLTQDAAFRNDAYIIDVPCIKWRPLTDSDTQFLEGRQDNDFDGRKDCWLTEGGYEIHFPENHMWIKGATGITA